MASVRIHRLGHLRPALRRRLHAAQREAGRVQHDCIAFHAERRAAGAAWPNRTDLHYATKGNYALHSQTIQQIANGVLANVDATRKRRRSEPASRDWLRYPYKAKRFHPVCWPAQAVSYNPITRRLVLPMGRGRASLVFRLDLDEPPGATKLVWCDGEYELHIVRPDEVSPPIADAPPIRAAIDLGEIHTIALVTDTGQALVVSGRGIRSHKRLLSKQLGQIARKRARCKRHSRRWRRLQAARHQVSRLAKRRVRDARHKATRIAINTCIQAGVTDLYVGNPHGVGGSAGRHHNQRMARWEYGKDIKYLQHKAAKAGMTCSTGDERGTSSRCPSCGHRHKPKGRVWHCKKCGLVGHRDVVGATNMHVNGFHQPVTFPAQVTYRRAAPMRARREMNNRALISAARRSRPDTALPGENPGCCLDVQLVTSTRFAGHRKVQPKTV